MAEVQTEENKQLAQEYDAKLSSYKEQQAANTKLKKTIEAEMDKVHDWLENNLRLRSTVLAEEVVVAGRKDMKTFTVKYFTGKSVSF